MTDLSAFEKVVEEFLKPAEIDNQKLVFLCNNENIKEVRKLNRSNSDDIALIKDQIGLEPEEDIPYASPTIFYQGITHSGKSVVIMYTPSLDRAEVLERQILR